MTDKPWEQARLIPVSGINGSDEQERRGVSALLAVVNSVREFGRSITAPLGAPAGVLTAYIEVPFTSGDKKVRPDGLMQVKRGGTVWTALVEVKTGANELKAPAGGGIPGCGPRAEFQRCADNLQPASQDTR